MWGCMCGCKCGCVCAAGTRVDVLGRNIVGYGAGIRGKPLQVQILRLVRA